MKRIFVALVLSLSTVTLALAQTKVPMDTAIRYGKLDNGLTYYIRHNKLPEKRADFYIVQNVGSILEEDHQNGLAHFLEHMAFNGTKNYPGKALINYFESIGAQFGTNLNAYTSLDETVYMLRSIPVVRPSIVDSALLILHDWSGFISLEGDEIDKERGVILEEWRTGANASRRMWKEGNKLKYPGSQYAKRDVIGDTAVIKHFTYDALRAYYKKWYRPDQQALIIVGDIDVNQVEQTLKRQFADIPKPVNPAPRVYYPIPDNQEPIVAIVTDPEATMSALGIEFKHKPKSDAVLESEEGADINLTDALISSMLNDRFEKLTRNASCPFVGGFGAYGDLVRTCDAFNIGIIAKEGFEKPAFSALLTEIERMKRYGFTQSELDRAKSKMLASYEKAYNERDKVKNDSYVGEYVGNFLEKEIIPGITWEYKHAQKALKERIDLAVINKAVQGYFTENNIVVDISASQKPSVKLPTKEEVLTAMADAKKNYVAPYTEEKLNKPLLKKAPKAGSIVKEQINPVFGTTEWTLSNGVRVILKSTDFKNDEIQLAAFSPGGTSLVSKMEDLPSAKYTDEIIRNNGLAKFSQLDLKRLLAGKTVNVRTDIKAYEETVSGTSSLKDMETFFKLIYLNFTAPRKDEAAFNAYMQELKTVLANASSDPRKIFRDTVSTVMNNYNPRLVLANLETLKKVDQDKAFKIYKERFANPVDFTFVLVGSFKLDSIKPFVLTYLGGMKTKSSRETWKDNNVRNPSGQVSKNFDQAMQVEKNSIYINYWGGMPFNLTNKVNLSALADILDIRYTESIREDEGGTYGVGVYADLSDVPQEQASLSIVFDTNKEKAPKLISIVQTELDKITKDGVRADDLDKVKKNLLKRYAENQKENGWWKSAIVLYEQDKLNLVSDYETTVKNLSSESIQNTLKALLIQKNRIEIKMNPKGK